MTYFGQIWKFLDERNFDLKRFFKMPGEMKSAKMSADFPQHKNYRAASFRAKIELDIYAFK